MNLSRFKWTMRVVALVELFMLTIGIVVRTSVPASVDVHSWGRLQTLKRRIEPPTQARPFFAWHDFKKPAFNVLILSGILGFLGLYTRRFRILS